MSLPEFENPPVIEVVTGVYFKKIEGFKLPHFGLFWEKVKSHYPHCEHAPSLMHDPAGDDIPWPRVWLINEDKTSLIQMQNDCFFFNWRRGEGNESYPSYSVVIKEFRNRLSEYHVFLEEQGLPELEIKEYELSYINHIPAGVTWEKPVEIGNFAPDLKWRKHERFLPDFKSASWAGVFDLPDEFGTLTISIKHGERRVDGTPVYILQLSSKGLGGDANEEQMKDWFDLSHEWIVRGFSDFTDSGIQENVWGKHQ